MSTIPDHIRTIGIAQGATWGTAVQATDKLSVTSFNTPASRETKRTGNHDRGFLPGLIKQGRETLDVSPAGQASFGENWLKLYALFAGVSTAAPAEVNVGEGDYLHNIDIGGDSDLFFTVAYEGEDDTVHEVPSATLGSFGFNFQENEPVTWTTSGMGNTKVLTGAATTNAQLNALADAMSDEMALLNGANAYVRIGSYSGSALSASDDVTLASASISLTRPRTRYYGLRGASSRDTYQPYQSGLLSGQFQVTLAHMDDAEIDLFSTYKAGTIMMAELFVDGAQIGTGANTSLKFQLPYLTPINDNGSDGISGQATLAQPSLTFEMGVAPSAPTGMTGVTNMMRLAAVVERSTAYLA